MTKPKPVNQYDRNKYFRIFEGSPALVHDVKVGDCVKTTPVDVIHDDGTFETKNAIYQPAG